MNMPGRSHIEFEQALYEAFPPFLRPSMDSMPSSISLLREAKRVLSGATWPEVVGHRLTYGEMDLSLSIWMDFFPAQVFDYYVASHLMFASLSFENEWQQNYVMQVCEAFLLPPAPGSGMSIADIDDELSPDAAVVFCGSTRLDFYRRITPAQRGCVGRFLDLYLGYRRHEFTGPGVRMFEHNRDYWLHSSR